MIKCANTRNRGEVCLFPQNLMDNLLVTQNIQFEFRQVLRHY